MLRMPEQGMLDTKQKTAMVMELLRKDLHPRQICDRYGVDIHQLADWVFRFVTAGEKALEEEGADAIH